MNEVPEAGSAATSLDDEAPGRPLTGAPGRYGGEPPADPVTPRRRGRRLLVALFVASVTVAVAAGAVLAVVLVHRPRPGPSAAHPLRATVFGLRPGQCFTSLPNGIAGADAVPCARPHAGEVYGRFRVAGGDWPGGAVLASRARSGCQARLAGYLNPQLATTGLAEFYAYPDRAAWAAGQHTVVCEIRSTQGTLAGSVRASGP